MMARAQFINALSTIHLHLGLFVTHKPLGHTRHSARACTLSPKINGSILQRNNIDQQHLYCCRVCITREPIHRQARPGARGHTVGDP